MVIEFHVITSVTLYSLLIISIGLMILSTCEYIYLPRRTDYIVAKNGCLSSLLGIHRICLLLCFNGFEMLTFVKLVFRHLMR